MYNKEINQNDLTMLKDLYTEYAYAFMGFSDFCNFINKVNLKKNDSQEIKKYIIKYIRKSLEHNKVSIIINYITSNIDINNNSYEELMKIINWLRNINYMPTSNIIIELLEKSESFNYLIASIVEQDLEKIKKQQLKKEYDDELLMLFLDIYCTLKNIDIQDEQNILAKAEDFASIEDDNSLDLAVPYGAAAIIREIKSMNLDVLTPEEEKDLLLKIKNGDEDAFQYFYYHNLRLVVNVAKKFVKKGVSFEDLIQEGSISLMNIIKHFDIEKGYKFSSYATWAIKKNLLMSIAQYGRTIRIPHVKNSELHKYYIKVLELEKDLGHELSDIEIAKHLNMTIEEVKDNNNLLKDCLSLNQKIGEDEKDEICDFISDNTNVENELFARELSQDMKKLLQKTHLTKKEMIVLKYRFGLDDSPILKLEQIGKSFGMTREGVRRIETKALNKLRDCAFAKKLVDYLDYPDKGIENLNNFPANPNEPKTCKSSATKKNIYFIYGKKHYTREEIDLAIGKLDDLDKEILQLFYNVDIIQVTTIDKTNFNKCHDILLERTIPNLMANLKAIKAKKLSRK